MVLGWALQTGRFYEGENLQILAIFVKLSVVCFKQQWLCSYKGIILFFFLPNHTVPPLALGPSWAWFDAPPQLGSTNSERSEMRTLAHTLIYRWGNLRGCPGLARLWAL